VVANNKSRYKVLTEPKRSDELVRCIRYLTEDENARTRLGRNASEKAWRYDWKIIINEDWSLYRELR
jgi:glycosyltransferase involved in cell wall biosynthesis